MSKLSKKEVENKIKDFFKNINNKSPREIKKIKKLAMSKNIKLKNLRKRFCKRCYSPKLKILSIKKKIKRVQCEECGYIMRWKLK